MFRERRDREERGDRDGEGERENDLLIFDL